MPAKKGAQKGVDVLELAKRRGFFWPAFELYGGAAGFYDYGPLGALLKLRVEELIRDFYVREEGCLLLESPVLTPLRVWEASGHTTGMTDLLAECTKCKEPHRADHLVEEKTGASREGATAGELDALIAEKRIRCQRCGGPLGKVMKFNIMFATAIGPGARNLPGALRPETAQTTYLPFRRLYDLARKKLPFGVIQVGKSFRNEISPRKANTRLREFSQAEVQWYVLPDHGSHPRFSKVAERSARVLTKEAQTAPAAAAADAGVDGKGVTLTFAKVAERSGEWIAYFLAKSVELFERMGIAGERLRLRQHLDDERAFYSRDTWDVEYESPLFGRLELVGIADRGDYDLGRHARASGQELTVETPAGKAIPHVVEVAYGIDRPVFCALESAARMDGDRPVTAFPLGMAPYQVAVFPLVSKDGLPERAQALWEELRSAGLLALYDEGFIGKVYYRQDEAGTMFCVTVDHDTLKDGTVTVRDRDTQDQVRVPAAGLAMLLQELLAGRKELASAGKKVR
ncbi:MAG TPA: glycine--tRNA ligase [archaeon]|nr:glycine--tRNA ligase [archaeon]